MSVALPPPRISDKAAVMQAQSTKFSRIPLSRRVPDKVFGVVCMIASLVGIALLGLLLYRIGLDGYKRVSPTFLTTFDNWRPHLAGVKAALVGTIWVMVLTALFSVPIGVAAAVYLEEFNRRKSRFSEFIQLNISNLAGVPSIVYGILGLTIFVRWLALGQSVLAGALTMSLLVLPLLITVTQEALKAVPPSLREGSFALGATEWQTIYRQVLPAASPGIMTGIILSMSRAIGETAPLLLVGAAGFITFVPQNLKDGFTVLPIQIYSWANMPEPKYQEAAAAAIIVLLVSLLLLNMAAILLRIRASKKLRP